MFCFVLFLFLFSNHSAYCCWFTISNEKPTQSGEALLVEAYAVIWLIAMAFVVIAWRRTRMLEAKIEVLEKAIDRANLAATPSTQRSPKSDPAPAKPAAEA